MTLFERYIVRRTMLAFAATLVVLAGVVWVTQALRQLDLVTAKGQAIGAFAIMTAMALPFLVGLIAPIALVIAVIFVLARMNADSEIVVAHAAGASRWLMLRPLLVVALIVSLSLAAVTTWAAPAGLRAVRAALTEVRVDLIASIVRPGRFTQIDQGLTFHIGDRTADGSLVDVMLDDERDPERTMTFLARRGTIVEAVGKTLLVMTDGTLQRQKNNGDMQIIRFDAYGFDLTNLVPEDVEPVFRPSERALAELVFPDPGDAYVLANAGRLSAELHDRLSQPLYPFAFVILVFLFLGDPRTSRQERSLSIAGAVLTVAVLRLCEFGATTLAIRYPAGIVALYMLPVATSALGLAVVFSGRRLALPAPVARTLERVEELVAAATRRGAAGQR